MGSWNKTCGLSNLPILAGEQTYVFVLEQELDISSHCYSTHLYRPALLSFESTYNDCGGGEDSKGIGFDIIMNGIQSCLVEMPLGENEYHDIAVSKAAFNEELFFDSVREGRLYVTNYTGGSNRVEFTMFRKDIVDKIVETRVIKKYVGKGAGTTGYDNSYVTYKFSDLVAEIPEVMNLIAEHYSDAKWYLVFF